MNENIKDFFERIKSFTITNWFAKNKKISPYVCA